MDEDWDLLKTFLPSGWEGLAESSGALKGLRKDRSAGTLLRVLLLHLGCGHSLRETAVRARRAGLADLSAVALMKRLRKSQEWLRALCVELWRERGLSAPPADGLRVRAFDATTVSEPGRTGSLWRVHYSVGLPSLRCDFFKLTATKGRGTREALTHFPVREGDHVLADRGYSSARGIAHVASAGGHVTVRVNTGSLPLLEPEGEPFGLLEAVSTLDRPGQVGEWAVRTAGTAPVAGRVCALRKSEEAARLALGKLRQEASRKGKALRPETRAYARYVILFTTFPASRFDAAEVLDWYRLRWQVELVFKRFKSLAQLGHLPKLDDESAKAWLHGKLLTALLVEKLISHATAVSPWGYGLARAPHPQPVAGLPLRPQPRPAGH